MYSSFEHENINILNKKDLIKYANEKAKESEYWDCYIKAKYSFKAFDNWKLQGYWYKEWCNFLVEVAEFIEGEAFFQYEEGQPFYLDFEKGEVKCHYIPLSWETMNYKEIESRAEIPIEQKVAKRL